MESVMNDVMEIMKGDSFNFPILPSNSTSIEDIYEFKVEGRRFESSCEKGEVPDGDECSRCIKMLAIHSLTHSFIIRSFVHSFVRLIIHSLGGSYENFLHLLINLDDSFIDNIV